MSKRGRLLARGLGLAMAVLMWLPAAGAQAQQKAGSGQIAAAQDVVTLLSVKSVHADPSFASRPLATVIDERPITLVRTTLPVLKEANDANGRAWLRVRLPGRVFDRKTPPPTGWITASDTRRGQTAWHLVVDVDARRVVVYHDGARKRSFRVIVGKPSTPTPRGKYFIEETMRLPAGHVGAPFALAASARSRVFWSFMGGPGQVALHGVKNVGGRMGTAVSNGCVRMTSDAIVWLAQRIKAGVPLTIR
jgi:lipoprotein-anchoring transpeptidase ErfK/SrfK